MQETSSFVGIDEAPVNLQFSSADEENPVPVRVTYVPPTIGPVNGDADLSKTMGARTEKYPP